MTSQLEVLYKDLLHTYVQGSSEQFVKKAKDISAEVKGVDVDFEYEGLIPYPQYDDNDFNEKIFAKKEFNRNKAQEEKGDYIAISQSRCSPSEFKLSPSQRFIKGFFSPLTPYNSLLLYHQVGVGKTCTAISIAEQYHEIYQKRVLVILSSTLKDNFKKQIFDITRYDLKNNKAFGCTGTKYPDMVLGKNIDAKTLDTKINKLISQRYQFMGYKELAMLMDKIEKKLQSIEPDSKKREQKFIERLSDIFSNRLIIIDEAHNLRNPSETGKKLVANAFKTLLKHVHGVKLVLLTATPMFNNAKEIAWTMNLLLSNDKRKEISASKLFDANGVLTETGKKTLINVARGYVSFMRGENPYTFPFRLFPSVNEDPNVMTSSPSKDVYGNKIPTDKRIKYLEIITASMSAEQKSVYDKLKVNVLDNVSEDVDDEIDDESVSNDLQNTLQVSNIVYPEVNDNLKGRYGNQGLDACFYKIKNKFSYKPSVTKQYGQFLSYDTIDKYAPKMKRILDYVIKSKGIVFIYSRYYASGIIPLAIALEHIGMSKYGSSNITNDINVQPQFGNKSPKYVILSNRQELSPNNVDEITAIRAKDNINGDKIKVVIVSKVGTEGIDFKGIREVHLLEPWFNLNRAEQIIGRAVRYCSHIDLPKEKRNVTIYFHACSYSKEEESIDLRTYRQAELKQRRIAEVEQVLKENSIDCNLNKSSLTFPPSKMNVNIELETSQGSKVMYDVGDRDYSFVCGFAKCAARCNPELKSDHIEKDTSTFETSFIRDDIELYKQYIAALYSTNNRYTYKQIFKALVSQYDIEEEILLFALDEMVTSRYIVADGNKKRGHLIYRGEKYMYQPIHMSDTRMTMEERDNPLLLRKGLPLSTISHMSLVENNSKKSNQVQHETSSKDITEQVLDLLNKSKNAVSKIIIDSVLGGLSQKSLNVIKSSKKVSPVILEYIDELSTVSKGDGIGGEDKLLKKVDDILSSMDDVILDSVIDRLDRVSFEALVGHIASLYNIKKDMSDFEKRCFRSLLSAGVIIESNGKIRYYYNHFDGNLYCINSQNVFKVCNTPGIIDEYETVLKKLQIGIKDEAKSYVVLKKGELAFKIKDSKETSGYVCHNTSSLKLLDLKNRINQISSGLMNPNMKLKFNKPILCYLYEILTRLNHPLYFQRPYFLKIDTKKSK